MVSAGIVLLGMDHRQCPAGEYAGRTARNEISPFTNAKSTTGIRPPSKRNPCRVTLRKENIMPTVNNPPALVAQETPSWCFAAVEQMVRAYRELAAATQYAIARRNTAALATVDPEVQERWELALILDQSAAIDEMGGANPDSNIVRLVSSQWNAFDHATTGGHFVADLTPEIVRGEIDNNRVFVIGTHIHYYVVYGYTEAGKDLELHILDPWPTGHGGSRTRIGLQEFLGMAGHTAITFG